MTQEEWNMILLAVALIIMTGVAVYFLHMEHKEEMARIEGKKEANLFWVHIEEEKEVRKN